MSENATETTAKPAKKTFNRTLRGADGATFKVVAESRKNGTYRVFAVHTTRNAEGAPVNKPGASSDHPNEGAATKAVEALVAKAVELGWQARTAGFGTRKPDAFTAEALPKPGKAAAPAAPKAKK
jgi:hypothetical protein